MNELTLLLLLALGMITLLDWRKGLLMCVVMGIAQDPLRKVAPGQPVYYVLLVGVIFAVAWLRASLLRVPLGPSAIHGWRQYLKTPFTLFVFVVLAQAMHSYVRFSSPLVPGIGLLVWLAPVPAVLLAYQFAIRRGLLGVRRWMALYSAIALAALSGVYLEYVGFDSRLLGEIGEGQIIYDVGTALKAHSGFFRASEIAAWHTAAIACFAFTVSIGKRPTVIRVLAAVGFIAVVGTLGILTGRRKMLLEITIFLCCYFFLFAWLQRGMARLAVIIVAMGFAGYIGIVGFVAPDLVQSSYTKTLKLDDAARLEGYAVRGQSVIVDMPERVRRVGYDPLVWSLEHFGWTGAGLGTGSQGTNEVVERHEINRWAAEGGLGKIIMELGVPGFIVTLWLLVALCRHVGAFLIPLARTSPQHARMAFGLLSFLVANFATFSVATQAYSDLFVLLILGWVLGFLFAMPKLAARSIQEAQATRAWGAARQYRPGLGAAAAQMAPAQTRQ